MDDPTSEMDPLEPPQFFQWLAQVKETTVFIVTSEIDDLCEVADVVWGAARGSNGSPAGRVRCLIIWNRLADSSPDNPATCSKMDWRWLMAGIR